MTSDNAAIGVILNPNAGHFRTRKGEKEFRRLVGDWRKGGYLQERYKDRIVIGAKHKADDIQYTCDEFFERGIALVVTVGGDGTQGNIHTSMARRAWERNKKDLEWLMEEPADKPMINFLKLLNTANGVRLPYFYNVIGGTVYVCSKMIGATDSLEHALDNAFLALDKGQGMESFRRIYIPTIIGYSAEEPDNPSRMEVFFQYADAGIRRFFDEYYKDKGPGKPDMSTAYWLIAKAITSLPIPGGFVYQLGEKIPCNVEVNGIKLPIEKRSALVASTIHGSLYGLEPFHRARRKFEDFERHYEKGEMEEAPGRAAERPFHIMTGDVDPWRIFLSLKKVFKGEPADIKGMYDILAREVVIEQLGDVKYIADGTRKEEGRTLVLTSGFEIGVPLLHEPPLLNAEQPTK
ncbi:acylglycerol kinase family protein [Candidatus Woesearchaeota archaeon]|nr:acylglycerol kinase family protein [Candidatus Woesearchaeota archaeon]